MFRAYGSRRLAATVVCVLAQSGRTKCSKEDDKKPPSDFSAFINKLGDKEGDIMSKMKEAAKNFSGEKTTDFSSMLDGTHVRKIFESGMPGEVCRNLTGMITRKILCAHYQQDTAKFSFIASDWLWLHDGLLQWFLRQKGVISFNSYPSMV
jgi:hypothetical protein